MKTREDGFEARERLGSSYWRDKRWKKVKRLQKEGKILEANGLVLAIRESWGLN
jgi:hypothetical protein